MHEFFAMGGYGGFVWPAYLLAAAIMAGLWLFSARAARQSESTLDKLQERIRNRGER